MSINYKSLSNLTKIEEENSFLTILVNIYYSSYKKDIYHSISPDSLLSEKSYFDTKKIYFTYKCQCNIKNIVSNNYKSNIWECKNCKDKVLITKSNIHIIKQNDKSILIKSYLYFINKTKNIFTFTQKNFNIFVIKKGGDIFQYRSGFVGGNFTDLIEADKLPNGIIKIIKVQYYSGRVKFKIPHILYLNRSNILNNLSSRHKDVIEI